MVGAAASNPRPAEVINLTIDKNSDSHIDVIDLTTDSDDEQQ
jgi:hypothetical protein